MTAYQKQANNMEFTDIIRYESSARYKRIIAMMDLEEDDYADKIEEEIV